MEDFVVTVSEQVGERLEARSPLVHNRCLLAFTSTNDTL
jgi:hypothetical protein